MKIVDNHIFKIISYDDAKALLQSTNIDVFALREDASEVLIESHEELGERNAAENLFGISVGNIDPAQLFQDEAQRIANHFKGQIAAIINQEDRKKIDEVNYRNRLAGLSLCETHNYCDANEPMSAAFEEVTGREILLNNQPDIALWNRAWEIAVVDGFSKI